MSAGLRYLITLGVGAMLASSWLSVAVLARLSDAVYLPQAIRFVGGAIILLFLNVISRSRAPHISLRLLHAALTVAGTAYFISPLLMFYALKTLPSGLAGLAFSTMPMWLLLVAYNNFNSQSAKYYFLILLGIGLVGGGCYESAELRGNAILGYVYLLGSIFTFLMGVWVSKRMFWLHSAVDVNFWSMTFAALGFLLLAVVHKEGHYIMEWDKAYWTYLTWLTVAVTGFAAYFYRAELMRRNSVTLITLMVPLCALGLGLGLWRETPLNVFVLSGAALVVISLYVNARVGRPSIWMCLALNNDKRQEDRLICLIDGFVRHRHGGKPARLQVTDLSIGGLGFRSELPIKEGDQVVVTLPLGRNWTSVTVEARAKYVRVSQSREFPFRGGLQFEKLSAHRGQVLVEFLARLSKAEEETTLYQEAG